MDACVTAQIVIVFSFFAIVAAKAISVIREGKKTGKMSDDEYLWWLLRDF